MGWPLAYLTDETGAAAAEYALILMFVAIVVILGFTVLGTTISHIILQAGSTI